MKTLFQSIYTKYLASDLPAEGMTGLYNTQAPSDAEFPYGIFTLVSAVQDFTFTETFEDCLIQFSLFSDVKSDSTEVCNLFELLKATFDFVDLTVSGYKVVSFVRGIANLLQVEGVWQYTISYRILLQEN